MLIVTIVLSCLALYALLMHYERQGRRIEGALLRAHRLEGNVDLAQLAADERVALIREREQASQGRLGGRDHRVR